MSDVALPVGSKTGRSEDDTGTASAVQAPPFRRDADDPSFPGAGMALLALLLVVAAWAWWAGRGRTPGPWQAMRKGPAALLRARATGAGSVRIVESVRFDVAGRVHVLQWQDEQILFATHGAGPIVVLGRRSATPRDSEAT